jgi:hypothetical protein
VPSIAGCFNSHARRKPATSSCSGQGCVRAVSIRAFLVSQRQLRISLADGRPLSSRLVPSAGNPLGNSVSEREADDQSNCNFQHWGRANF